MAAGWKPGGRSIEEKSSLLSDNAVALSSEDKSTTAGCREVACAGHMQTHCRLELLP